MAFHLRGVVLPDGEERDLYVVGERITLSLLHMRRRWLMAGGCYLAWWTCTPIPAPSTLAVRWMRRCCAGTVPSTATRG
jgi:hypothetical protein